MPGGDNHMNTRRKLGVVALGCAAMLLAAGGTRAVAAPAPTPAATSDTGDEDTSTDMSPDDTSLSVGARALGLSLNIGATLRLNIDGKRPHDGAPQGGLPCPALNPARPYFYKADWLWNPIPANPALDPQSATFGDELGDGVQVANLKEYAATLRTAGYINTFPRYDVAFEHTDPTDEDDYWGPDPFGSETAPIPHNTPIPTGEDKALAIQDKSRCMTYNLLYAQQTKTGWTAEFGALARIDGDGRETYGGTSTGSNIARFAAVVRAKEITAGQINHALFFSTDMAAKGDFRYPAAKTDGSNMSDAATPLPEGARVQLDPSINLDAIPGITKFELAVGHALQRYGAYCGDNGGARMAFIFEYVPKLKPYMDAGADGDYFNMPHIPWKGNLRVLNQSDGR